MFARKEKGALSRKEERQLNRKIKNEVLNDKINNPIVRTIAGVGTKKVIKLTDNKLIDKLPEQSKKEIAAIVNSDFKFNNMKDWRSTIAGAMLAAIVAIQPIIESGQIDWINILIAAAIAALGYIVRDPGKASKEVK